MKKKPAYLPDVLSVVVLLFSAILIFNGCKKNVPGDQPAEGSLENEKGICLPATVNGRWYSGIAPDADTNYVEIGVNVTKTGHYRILSDVQDGIQFADSGVFPATGLRIVRLKANGAFIHPSSSYFTITFDSSVCGFSVDVHTLPLPDNTWRFTARGRTYTGFFGSQLYFLPNALGSIYDIIGPVASGEDTILSLEVYMPPGGYDIHLGTFYTNNSTGSFQFYRPGPINFPGHEIFVANSDKPDKLMTIVLSGFGTARDGTRQVLGSFSGIARDTTEADVKINGVFSTSGAPYPFHF